MKIVFKPRNTYEEVNCYDFREYEHGVVLHDEQGYNIGYVPHEILSHIEPHPGEEVAFEDGDRPARDEEEDGED